MTTLWQNNKKTKLLVIAYMFTKRNENHACFSFITATLNIDG